MISFFFVFSCFSFLVLSPFFFLVCFFLFLGSYALHKDPKSEAILCVSVSVSMFEDEKTRDRSPRVFIIWQVDWVLVIPSCFVGHYCFQRVVVVVYAIVC